jgi:hypothetical protein
MRGGAYKDLLLDGLQKYAALSTFVSLIMRAW